MANIPMTPNGHKNLQAQFKQMKNVARPAAVEALAEARSHGDLSENAEYDVAKANLALLDKQLSDIEQAIANAQIIDPATISHDKIVFGATVKLRDAATDEEVQYQIVGIYESDIAAGKISIESPIARALIGKEEGDEAKVTTPRGQREFEIITVSYGA